MHDNILQSIGNRQQPMAPSYGFSSLEDIFSRKTSAVVQPMPVHPATTTPEKENLPLKPVSISPVLPGTGSVTHNITRMLGDSIHQPKSQLPSAATRASHFSPYSTSHFLSFRHKVLQESKSLNREDDSVVDVETNSHDHPRAGDSCSATDMSISTQGSTSPQSVGAGSSPSGSTNSSPGSNTDAVTSPENTEEQPKKKARTNYTNEQVQALLKIFHETPYPDSEMMENIGKDLGIPENKIKIWFQNKRARWRRRVNDNMNTFPQPYFPMSPMLSPVAPYGFMPTGHMMASSSPQHIAGYFNYPWMQGSLSPNNNQQLPGQFTANQGQSRLQATNHGATLPSQHFPAVSMAASAAVSSASTYGMKTSPQQLSQPNRHFQVHPSFLYQSGLGASTYGQNSQ